MWAQTAGSVLLLPVLIAGLELPNETRRHAAASTADSSAHRRQANLDRVLSAPTALHMRLAYEALLEEASPDDLLSLRAGIHDSISLQVAWKQALRHTFDERPKRAQRRGMRLDRGELHRFLGFVEGRTRVAVPEWWKNVVLRARAFNRDSFHFPAEQHLRYEKTTFGPYAPPGTAIEEHGQNVVLRAGGESFTIPAAVLDQNPGCSVDFSALVTAERWYLALHGSNGGEFPLFCIDRESGKVLWKASVWANGTVLVYSGIFRAGERHGDHAVTIKAQGDRIVVFGAEGISAYVEAFKADNGENLLRFCTSY